MRLYFSFVQEICQLNGRGWAAGGVSRTGLLRTRLAGEANGSMRRNVKKMAAQRCPVDSKTIPYSNTACDPQEQHVPGVILVTV